MFLKEVDIITEELTIDNVEADDVIARICNLRFLNDKIKIIVSADKDFFQLCNDTVIILRPIQEEILNVKRIVDKFGIHPNNFALARAIVGDKSDNLDGVSGVGLKSVSTRLSFLKEERSYTLTELYDFCESVETKLKIHQSIIENKDKLNLNYKMMQLYSPNIPPNVSKMIKDTVEGFIPIFNQTAVIKKFINDGMTDYNWDVMFQIFRSIAAENKTFKAAS